jgi:hypothetical protein
MASAKTELLQGTLNLLILKTLALGPNHGLGIARVAVSRTPQAGGEGVAGLGMGRVGEQPTRQVLPTHPSRPAPAPRGNRELGTHRAGHWPGLAGHIGRPCGF